MPHYTRIMRRPPLPAPPGVPPGVPTGAGSSQTPSELGMPPFVADGQIVMVTTCPVSSQAGSVSKGGTIVSAPSGDQRPPSPVYLRLGVDG